MRKSIIIIDFFKRKYTNNLKVNTDDASETLTLVNFKSWFRPWDMHTWHTHLVIINDKKKDETSRLDYYQSTSKRKSSWRNENIRPNITECKFKINQTKLSVNFKAYVPNITFELTLPQTITLSNFNGILKLYPILRELCTLYCHILLLKISP